MQIALVYADRLDSEALYPLQQKRLEQLESILRECRGSVTKIPRSYLPNSLDAFDLVVAAGGDGTQLDAACRLQAKPLCALRLFPESSVGYHCTLDYHQFAACLDQFTHQKGTLIKIPRLQCLIDGAALPPPILNDVLLANTCPARASRYCLNFKEIRQNQCSSGLWIATQPGSHGGARSAGAQPLPPDALGMALFQVRECPQPSALRSGIFTPGLDPLSIEINGTDTCLFLDGGLASYSIKPAQILTFREHPFPLIKFIP